MSSYHYVVVGPGMQGTAAAYDLARFGNAGSIVLADYDLEGALKSADRVNRLVGGNMCSAAKVDAKDPAAVSGLVAGSDVVLSCVPYKLHASVEEGCLLAGVSAVDMGNDTDVTLAMLDRDGEWKSKGATFVPDTGLAPGLVNSIGAYFLERMPDVTDVKLYCGGLPQNPKPPFNYSLRFSIEGLVGEYVDEAIAIRDHQVVRLDTLTELETVMVEGLGELEAFTTSSGTSTAPFTLKDRVRNYEYKTLRFPGHCKLMRIFRDFGFWNEDPITVDGAPVVPLHAFHEIMGPRLIDPADKDMVVTRGVASGPSGRIQVDILDRQDEETGFAAMERLTGFSTSIMAIAVAEGRVRKGAVPYEQALPGSTFLDEIRRRGISVVES